MTKLWDCLTAQQDEWLRQGLVSLYVPGDDEPDSGLFIARGAKGDAAVGKTPRLAIEALHAPKRP